MERDLGSCGKQWAHAMPMPVVAMMATAVVDL